MQRDKLAMCARVSENSRMLAEPKASVLVVNYNGQATIERLLRSLLAQTLQDIELVVVDCASTDSSLNLIRSILESQSKVSSKLITSGKNLGYCEGYNLAARQSRGKYLAIVTNDMELDRSWLQQLVNFAEKKGYDAVLSKITFQDINLSYFGQLCDKYGCTIYNAQPPTSERDFFYGSGSAFLIRRSVFFEVGAFDPLLFMYQDDVDLFWRLRLFGKNIGIVTNANCRNLGKWMGALAFGERLFYFPILRKQQCETSFWLFYHAHAKNRIRVQLKNYSTINAVRIIPRTLVLVFLRCSLVTWVTRNPEFAKLLLRGVMWNIKNLKSTLIRRYKIQKERIIPDKEILECMIKNSLELRSIVLFRRRRY